MKRELYWLGGIGVGTGLMYWLDPDRGRHRRARTRAQLLSARHHVGDLMANVTPDLPPLHLPQPYRDQLMSPFRRQRRHTGSDVVLLVLGGLGLSVALAWMVRARNPTAPSGEAAGETKLQAVCDWACGAWDGVRTWFRPEVEATHATQQPVEREHEVTMMGVEAESTKEVEAQ